MIVDAHHHLWRYKPGFKPWLEAREQMAPLRRDFLGDELDALARENGVDRTVIVQAGDNLEDTAFMVESARRHRFIGGVVGWAPLDDPRATERALDAYAGEPEVKGFRHMIIWEPDPDWLVRPSVLESLALVAERGYTWDSTATIVRHLEHANTVSERIPALKHVIDHLGKPAAAEGIWEPWASLMKRAAQHPNVYVKLSGILNVATLSNPTKAQLQPYVDYVIETFGPRRVMIGSNWPVSNLGADYKTTWAQTVAMLDGLSATERAAVMGETATGFYGLG
ncbi:MAG: amidohydrolase family protein [Candidatus Eremiobacteraeota bacterium]|nr:amidohydrolase family protein [Candidatus Eremiobacteraeota bacterium]